MLLLFEFDALNTGHAETSWQASSVKLGALRNAMNGQALLDAFRHPMRLPFALVIGMSAPAKLQPPKFGRHSIRTAGLPE